MKRIFYIENDEAIQILISVLAISFAFTIVFAGLGSLFSVPREFLVFVALSVVTIGSGFVLHEMGHKMVAIYYGAYARFQMWMQGLVFMLITSLMGVLFAAPGAVYIYKQNLTKRENGIISIAGPVVNVLIMLVFFSLSVIMPKHIYFSFNMDILDSMMGNGGFEVWRFGAYLNFILCMFNMLPVFPLDGSKVFVWSKLYWFLFVLFMFMTGVGIGLIDLWFAIEYFIMLVFFSVLSMLLFGRR